MRARQRYERTIREAPQTPNRLEIGKRKVENGLRLRMNVGLWRDKPSVALGGSFPPACLAGIESYDASVQPLRLCASCSDNRLALGFRLSERRRRRSARVSFIDQTSSLGVAVSTWEICLMLTAATILSYTAEKTISTNRPIEDYTIREHQLTLG